MKILALKRKGTMIICLAGLLGLLVIYGVLPILRARSVAHPPRTTVAHNPEEFSLVDEDVSFEANDGLTLRGWYMLSHNGAVVIISHGYGGNRGDFLEQAALLSGHGYGVLLFDLSAHGNSDGSLLSLNGRDVLAAVEYVRNRKDVRPDRIGLWGFSLGGLVSIQAAAQEPSIRAVIADGPFPVVAATDMPAPETLADWLWIPFDWVQFQALKLQGVSGAMSTTEALARIAPRPLLLIAGIQNRGERRVLRKYYAAAGQTATLWEVAEAGHLGSWNARTDDYKRMALAIFDRALLGGSAGP